MPAPAIEIRAQLSGGGSTTAASSVGQILASRHGHAPGRRGVLHRHCVAAHIDWSGWVGQGKAVWAVGRHRAEPEVRRREERAAKQAGRAQRNPELLGWGVFLTGITALCLLWAGIPVSFTAGTSGLLLAAFVSAWYASRSAAPEAAAASPAPSSEPAAEAGGTPRLLPDPQPDTDAKQHAEVPPIPLAPDAAQEFLTGRRTESAVPGSRWTRTFGPPETGSLPVQPYVPALRASVQTADPDRQDRRQRSHSKL